MTAQPTPSKKDLFKNSLFDVEHALGMYALNYCTIPAESIYDEDALTPLMSTIENCHIYLIGYTPIIRFNSAQQIGRKLELNYTVTKNNHTLLLELPDGLSLKHEGDVDYLEDENGRRCWPSEKLIKPALEAKAGDMTFQVKYVGQAYGQSGSRNAIDRLLKHETLQKIALKGAPEGYRITLLMLTIQPNNQLITIMNPFAKNKDESGKRIESGLAKLFNTSEEERISLYEASLIRYFYPEFNIEFKNSFPSTNLKILQDCYAKDFSTVIAEICMDDLPFKLYSEKVSPSLYHTAKHDLHKTEDRKAFFGL
ncbi:hypothetical protein J4G52_15900 [Burkholderia cenocepacia]|uniref:hypothetical protein n=1 Tax=Burkholderia cenocepacia TaxID=95486 RepID=UPI001AA0F27E|nr:hypothetical protein [Burkholderia cenocepacia]MBO1855017.1 hypothetical protein [Burkholderia cenocepacia]MDR5642666.1 hypothetical protein [Burkholderia cenocepacia]